LPDFSESNSLLTCADATPQSQCSSNTGAPWYCSNSTELVENCLACGCPGDWTCPDAGTSCELLALQTYTAFRVASPPVVDGDLAEFVDANPLDVSGTHAYGAYRVLWDSTAVYVAGEVAEPTATGTYGKTIWAGDDIQRLAEQ